MVPGFALDAKHAHDRLLGVGPCIRRVAGDVDPLETARASGTVPPEVSGVDRHDLLWHVYPAHPRGKCCKAFRAAVWNLLRWLGRIAGLLCRRDPRRLDLLDRLRIAHLASQEPSYCRA